MSSCQSDPFDRCVQCYRSVVVGAYGNVFISPNCTTNDHYYCLQCAAKHINESLSLLNAIPKCIISTCNKSFNLIQTPKINKYLLSKYKINILYSTQFHTLRDASLINGFIRQIYHIVPNELVELIHDFYKLILHSWSRMKHGERFYPDLNKIISKQQYCHKCNIYSPKNQMMYWNKCYHTFCIQCVVTHIKTHINNATIPICLVHNCNIKVSVKDIKMYCVNANRLSHTHLQRLEFLLPHKLTYKLNGETFKLWHYYIPVKIIGNGTYNSVIEAKDIRFESKTVAIKKNKNVFCELKNAKRLLQEITLLSAFKHDDIIKLIDVIPPDKYEKNNFNDVYLVMHRMETTLKRIIKSDQKLLNKHYLFFIYQILRGLKYIHSAGCIHRNIKPENILVNGKNCNIKISDFGISRTIIDESNLTEYVVDRWYRAPEVMLCAKNYNEKVDLWSVGCIFAELLLRRVLFPGKNHFEQLSLIFSIIGTPRKHMLDWITSQSSDSARQWVYQLKYLAGHDLRKIFKRAMPKAIDLIQQLLKINPNQRIGTVEALSHPYFAKLHHTRSERSVDIEEFIKCIDKNFNDIEKEYNCISGVRHLMYETLTNFESNYKIKANTWRN